MNKEIKDQFFEELMKENYLKLHTFMSRRQQDKEFVYDVLQETFMEAYRKTELLMEHPNTLAWLYTTAKNKMMKMSSKRKELFFLDDETVNVLDDFGKGEVQYSEIELSETLKSSLGEREYEMFLDYYINGCTSEEIADKYGVEAGGIRMRMSRLKKKLRENLIVDWSIFVVCVWGLLQRG